MKALGKQKQRYHDRVSEERYEQERRERQELLDSLSEQERKAELAREREMQSKALRTFAEMRATVNALGGEYGGKI